MYANWRSPWGEGVRGFDEEELVRDWTSYTASIGESGETSKRRVSRGQRGKRGKEEGQGRQVARATRVKWSERASESKRVYGVLARSSS